MHKSLLFLSLLLVSINPARADLNPIKDPYAGIESIKLDNGLRVYLAPSSEASLFEFRLEVDVGSGGEAEGSYGLSHLLEHVLFRDKHLKDEMSYLQLIQEAGGYANGGTAWDQTFYFASIPHSKSEWLLSTLGKMILEPKFSDEYVEKEKSTVELERGRPHAISEMLQFDYLKFLFPKYLKRKDIWQTQFGVSFNKPYTLTEEQLSTPKLTTAQVSKHYDDYYTPSNMRLFISGKFNRDKMLQLITQKWGQLAARSGKKVPAPEAKFAEKPFRRLEVTDRTPSVYLGTLIWDSNLTEQLVLDSYIEYLAHRLMKEIRNLKGQTYSARGYTSTHRTYGLAYVQFETQSDRFDENLNLARKYIKDEAMRGGLSSDQVDEALKLYLQKLALRGREAEDMMDLAIQMASAEQDFGAFESPFLSLANVGVDQYNEILKKHFRPDRVYEQLYSPPLLFRTDSILWLALVAILTFMGLRKLLTKSFSNDGLRWVRKVELPPLRIFEVLILFGAYFAYIHFDYIVYSGLSSVWDRFATSVITSYLYSGASMFGALFFAQGALSLLPGKLMVMDHFFIIKSISYFSKRMLISDIQSIETLHVNPLSWKPWLKVKHRFYFFNPKFWQAGLMISLKDGRSYFFGVAEPQKAADELRKIVRMHETTVSKATETVRQPAA